MKNNSLLKECAKRLKNERQRVGYSQRNFAHIADVSSETVRLYELGKVNMSATFLIACSQLGLDIQFILTGVRSDNLDEIAVKLGLKETV